MKIIYHYGMLVFILPVLLFFGCENSEMQRFASELHASRLELEKSKNKNKRLIKRNQEISEKAQNLKLKYENLKIMNAELEEWSAQLVKSYGPSIWFFSKYDRPLPRERLVRATPQKLIERLNVLFKESMSPEVILIEIRENTAYVKISDDEQLTQRMGTSGAASYVASVVYTLTSIDSIHCVDFDFKEGDHASPEKFCP